MPLQGTLGTNVRDMTDRNRKLETGNQKLKTWEGALYFDPEDPIYQEHFCGAPVVPGSLMVHAFLTISAQAGFPSECLVIEQFSFRGFLSPGRCSYRVIFSDGCLHCRIDQGNKIIAKGRLRT